MMVYSKLSPAVGRAETGGMIKNWNVENEDYDKNYIFGLIFSVWVVRMLPLLFILFYSASGRYYF